MNIKVIRGCLGNEKITIVFPENQFSEYFPRNKLFYFQDNISHYVLSTLAHENSLKFGGGNNAVV